MVPEPRPESMRGLTSSAAGAALRLVALAAACLLPLTSVAQDYPSRPITIVVGFPAGSAIRSVGSS